jgi:hypothetical protein
VSTARVATAAVAASLATATRHCAPRSSMEFEICGFCFKSSRAASSLANEARKVVVALTVIHSSQILTENTIAARISSMLESLFL